MQSNFWHDCWKKGDIGFHEEAVNPSLEKHINRLEQTTDSRIFIPLCGKTGSIRYLLSKGYRVVGIELSEIAVEQLFLELSYQPIITKSGKLIKYEAHKLDVYVGDIFDLNSEQLGKVNAVFDRGALVALPETTRIQYTNRLASITQKSPQLLVVYDYDQSLMEGPPFSIRKDDLLSYYGSEYTITEVESFLCPLFPQQLEILECIWLIKPS